jgi:hypothetical protein
MSRMPRCPAPPELSAVVGRENARRLRNAGVGDLAWLLRIARTPEGREQLSVDTAIPVAQLLEWAHLVDLCRVEGIDPARAALLQKAGVRGLRELVASEARPLSLTLRQLDGRAQTRDGCDVRRVEAWIREARRTRPAVHDTAPPAGEAWDDAGLPIAGLEPLERPLPRPASSAAPQGRSRRRSPGNRS